MKKFSFSDAIGVIGIVVTVVTGIVGWLTASDQQRKYILDLFGEYYTYASHFIALVLLLLLILLVISAWTTRWVRELFSTCLDPELGDSRRHGLQAAAYGWIELGRMLWYLRVLPRKRTARLWVEIRLVRPMMKRPLAVDYDRGPSDKKFAADVAKHAGLGDDRLPYEKEVLHSLLAAEKSNETLVLECDDCNAIIESREAIYAYFEHTNSQELLCHVQIRHGFVAPTFLITGLLAAFMDEWEPIVTAYGAQHAGHSAHYQGAHRDFSAFRLFQFNCWLLWGPSIPDCTCKPWKASSLALQYGFGDENNSIDLIIPSAEAEALPLGQNRASADADHPMPAAAAPLARYAQVTGKLRRPYGMRTKLSLSQQTILCDKLHEHENRRLSLVTKADGIEFIEGTSGRLDPFYYSAYIWVMFVVCDATTQEPKIPLRPDHKAGIRDNRWQNLLPFFVHGNIAEPSSLRLQKQLLVHEAIAGIKQILSDSKNKGLSLHYTSAFDESFCGSPILGKPNNRERLRTMLSEAISADPELVSLQENRLVKVLPEPPDSNDDPERSYTSCALPKIIYGYYRKDTPS